MKKRKFQILNISLIPGGSGPERIFLINYKAIENKQWINRNLHIVARNEKEAESKTLSRFSNCTISSQHKTNGNKP